MPQLIPVGELVTVPEPVPVLFTVKVYSGLKVAVTVFAALILTVHVVPLLVLHPDQLLKR